MKIAWFSPFSKKSAIGKYSQIATDELSKHITVELWVSKEEENLLETNLKINFYSSNDFLVEKLKVYDLVIYNLGDYFIYHKDIFEISKQVSGVVILHDFIMHNFFNGYFTVYKNDYKLYMDQMERLYGETGKEIALQTSMGLRKHVCETDEVLQFPFFELAIQGSLGVITHSKFLTNKVLESYSEPVQTIYFPFQFSFEKDHNIKTNDRILLLSFGNVNRNKRIDKVIEVIGENEKLSKRIEYVVIGSGSDKNYLEEINHIIEKYNLGNSVRMLGYQTNKVLHDYMNKADIFVNLRLPAMEGASWSLLEQLYYSKPIIVSDNGFYSEIPDDCVVKVSLNNEKRDLDAALVKLIDNMNLREEIGKAGEFFARNNFTAENYADLFMGFVNSIIARKPILNFIDNVSSEMNLLGIKKDMVSVRNISMEINKIIN